MAELPGEIELLDASEGGQVTNGNIEDGDDESATSYVTFGSKTRRR